MGILATPEFWVAVSFFLFLGVIFYFSVHKKLASALDTRAERIKAELEDATRLRQEAEAVLADYKRKQKDAVKETKAIVAQAAKEAEILAARRAVP